MRGFTFGDVAFVGGAGERDPFYQNVSLLLPGDGTNGSTQIIDYSPSPKTITAVGDARISTAQSKFGGSSLAFDGAGDCIETNTSTDFTLGSADFTIECWARFSTLVQYTTTIARLAPGSSVDGLLFFHNVASGSGGLYMTSNGTSWDMINQENAWTGISTNTWYHIALTREGNVFRAFRDGTQTFTTTVAGTIYQSQSMARIGAANPYGAAAMNGHIDELRITKGIARYQSAFTPPTAPFPIS